MTAMSQSDSRPQMTAHDRPLINRSTKHPNSSAIVRRCPKVGNISPGGRYVRCVSIYICLSTPFTPLPNPSSALLYLVCRLTCLGSCHEEYGCGCCVGGALMDGWRMCQGWLAGWLPHRSCSQHIFLRSWAATMAC